MYFFANLASVHVNRSAFNPTWQIEIHETERRSSSLAQDKQRQTPEAAAGGARVKCPWSILILAG